MTDFQTKAQLHVLRQSPEVPVPKIYPAISGEYIHRRPVPETGETQAVRLISFVNGVPLFKTTTSRKQRAAVDTPDAFRTTARKESARWGKVISAAGIRLD